MLFCLDLHDLLMVRLRLDVRAPTDQDPYALLIGGPSSPDLSANRNVRRGGPSRPPTIDERTDALHLRSGPYYIGVTRARGLDGPAAWSGSPKSRDDCSPAQWV